MNKFNDLKKVDLMDKKIFEIVSKGKEFDLYRNMSNQEYVLHDIALDDTFSIGNVHEFLEVYNHLRKAIELEESEQKG